MRFTHESMAQVTQLLFLAMASQMDQVKLRRELERLANLPTETRLEGVREVVLAFAAQLDTTQVQRPASSGEGKMRRRVRVLSFFIGAVGFCLCVGAILSGAFFPAAYALVLALLAVGIGLVLLP